MAQRRSSDDSFDEVGDEEDEDEDDEDDEDDDGDDEYDIRGEVDSPSAVKPPLAQADLQSEEALYGEEVQ